MLQFLKSKIKINKIFNIFLLGLLLSQIFYFINTHKALAATSSKTVGCKIEWTILKPDAITKISSSMEVYKDQLTGYKGTVTQTGDKCASDYGGYYESYSVDKAGKKTPVFKFDDNKNKCVIYDFTAAGNIGFEGIQNSTKYLLDFNIYKKTTDTGGKVTCTALETLEITAVYKDQDAPASQQTGIGDHPQVETIINPIKWKTFTGLAFAVMKYFLGAIAGLAVVFIIIGAIQLMASQGNPEMVTRGKDTITWAVVGVVVALFAFSAVAIVQGLFY